METYKTILFLLSIVSFILYTGYIKIKYGIQPSISESFYRLKRKYQGLFTLSLWAFSLPLAIIGAEISPLFWFAAVFIMFVGAAPAFKDKGMVEDVHMVGAVGGILLSVLGFLVVSPLLALLTVVPIILLRGLKVRNYTWWVETAAFVGTWLGMLILSI